jgi:hypothetical protein
MGVGGKRHAPAALPPGMTRYPLYRRLGRLHNDGSWGNIVGIPTRLQIGWSRVRILIGAQDFSLLQNVQTSSEAHPASLSVGTGFTSWGGKLAGV